MRKFVLLALAVLMTGALFAQNRQVSGTVTDADGAPIIGAIVTAQGTGATAVSDGSGRYSISAPAQGVLGFSSLGYNNAEVAVENRAVVDVVLATNAELIDDVVVIAYGVTKRDSFTGSLAVIDDSQIATRQVSDVSKALAGLAPGVVTTSGGGQPGQGAAIQIRGTGSINASNDPLYVVDGAPYSGNISSINPNDIASISILKDASAGALYGSRGANGVIMITTKKGNGSGRVNVNFRSSVGVISRALKRYDTMDQREFVETTYAALKNQALYATGLSEAAARTAAANGLAALGGEQYNPFKNYTWQTVVDPETGKVRADAKAAWKENWMDEITNSSAMRQDYGLAVNGGDERTTYAMSVGYLKEDGTLKNTDFERFTGLASVDHNIRNWAKMGVSTAYTYSIQNGTQYSDTQNGNVWYSAQFMAPIYPMYMKDMDGNDVLDGATGERRFDYGDENASGSVRPKSAQFNSLGDLLDNKSEDARDIVRYGAYLTLGSDSEDAGWLQGLKFTVNMNGDVTNRRRMVYYNMYHGDAAASNGEITKELYRTASYTFNQLLTYGRTFGKHNVNVLAGHEYYDYEHYNLWATRSNLYDGIYELAPGVTVQAGDSYTDRDRIEAYFGRVNYGFDNKYFFDASVRRDGSSRFQTDHRWGSFWSVGASWRISQEKFMENVSWVDNLTYKISYGSQGNNQLLNDTRTAQKYYTWDAYYALTYPNANFPGAILASLANEEVGWETSAMFNTGIEATLFSGRLRVGIDYYIRNTTDMLLNYPMPISTGFTGFSANAGEMTNKGIEISLGGTIISKPNFVWDATLMGYANRNKVTQLTETTQIVDGSRVIEVGKPIYTWYMAKSAGVDPATGQQLYWVYDRDDDGNIINERISSDKAKAATSKYYQGQRIPDFQGSIGSKFVIYKNFDLSFLATYSLGGKVYDSVYSATMQPIYIGDTYNRHLLRAWSKPGDVTDIPRVEINAGYTTTDRWLIDASYLAINNITFGYSLPTRIVNRLNMGTMRAYVSLDNVAIFSHLDGMDPSYNFAGGTNYSYAPVRTMSVGLDINF